MSALHACMCNMYVRFDVYVMPVPVLTCVYDVHDCINTYVGLTCTCNVCFCSNSEERWEPRAPRC